MSEHMSACIKIGGRLSHRLVSDLCQAIGQQRLSLVFGEDLYSPKTKEDLLSARIEVDGSLVLQLCDDQARRGWLEELEPFLYKHQFPFDRQADANIAYGACLTQYRPGRKTRIIPTDSAGRPVVLIETVRPVADQLAQAISQFEHSPKRRRLAPFRQAHRLLKLALPIPSSPLPNFTIGGDP